MTKRLSSKEKEALESYVSDLKIRGRQTGKPIVIAIIGLTGSGKSSVAKELAKHLNATVISADDIRVQLREQKQGFDNIRIICINAAKHIIENGGNAIFDSDFIDSDKRKQLKKNLPSSVELHYIRVHCDRDVMIERVLKKKPHPLFESKVVKIREMWRRTPNHYKWEAKGGGNWILKKLNFKLAAEIDTSDENKWPDDVKKTVKKILN